MSRLNKVLQENAKAERHIITDTRKSAAIPLYGTDGKTINLGKKEKKKKTIMVISIVSGILLFIYLPTVIMYFIGNKDKDVGYTVALDYTAIKLYKDELSVSSTMDFDNDGIDNSKEAVEGTNPLSEDTDHDGLSDYYELYISKTNPLSADKDYLINEQKKLDQAKGNNVASPYRIENVILWADDYDSKAKGGVIESVNGYRFHDFSGYAQFPCEKGSYVYGVKDGVRKLLPYKEAENAWRVTGYDMVEIYSKPLEEIVEFDFFFQPVYADANWITRFFAFILPDNGFITAEKKTRTDVEPDTSKNVITDIVIPNIDKTDTFRFSQNTDSLSELQYVRTMIQDGRCVAVSLLDMEDGEYIGIIYGYTASGNLLIADPETMEPIGELYIKESAEKVMDNEMGFVLRTYFEWTGFGFSSDSGDRISFFSVSGETSSPNVLPEIIIEDLSEDTENGQPDDILPATPGNSEIDSR